jgi:hypothetical protein
LGWTVRFALLAVALFGLASAGSASAEIVYTQGTTAALSDGSWPTPASLYAMNDDGSDQHVLLSPSQVSSSSIDLSALCCSSLQPSSSVMMFNGFDYGNVNTVQGGDGRLYDGVYQLANGSLTRLSAPPTAAGGYESSDGPPALLANGGVVYDETGCTYGGSSPVVTGCSSQLDEQPEGGGTATPWGYSAGGLAGPPTTYAGDPADAGLLAYVNFVSANEILIGNQANTQVTTVATEPYNKGAVAWNPTGTELVVLDGTPAGDAPSGSGFSAGIWILAAAQNATPHEVLVDPNPSSTSFASSSFANPVFVGANEIVFEYDDNLWSVSTTSCTPCSISQATQLTTGGTATAPDQLPSWTSQTITVSGGSGSGGSGSGGSGSGGSGSGGSGSGSSGSGGSGSGGSGSGGSGSGGSGTPPAPTSSLGAVTSSSRSATLAVTCSAGTGSCQDTVQLTVDETVKGKRVTKLAAIVTKRRAIVVGTQSALIPAGASQQVTVTLDAAGRKLLTKYHKLPALVSLIQGTHTVGHAIITFRARKR